ncbi:dihydrodipicolinate synthase family protein [Bauldia litoralis]|uniref:4-hydroxy-tetrahydrodipicolinate synthase n=1 Tax=Bauldia litoralis TaxID=665467 RepID=A0A1G6ENA4_9HYPH|nr:dihydrodipicolinate synthase family protein [Bauldia litoralis]SDB59003.1 4-hydroxy-tetrahydrodipicolinate synthase [Bauldia litoralis]
MSASAALRGVLIPLTTPFCPDGEIDEKAFREQIAFMTANGVDGVVVGGSTGEGYALSGKELMALVAVALDTAAGRIPVVVSIMADSTRAAVARARAISGLPVTALQIAPPHYIFSPQPEGQADFYGAIAGAVALPIIIYNVIPWDYVTPATAARIMQRTPSVTAVKQSDTDLGAYATLVETVGAERVFAAIDAGLMSCYELGAAGSIAAISTAAPRAAVALWRAVQEGDRARATSLHKGLVGLWAALSSPNLPARVKAALALQGVEAGVPRSPMAAPSDAEVAAIAEALSALSRCEESIPGAGLQKIA